MDTVDPSWMPRPDLAASARITDFGRFASARCGRTFDSYGELWSWSVAEPAEFWAAIWDYFQLGPRPEVVLASADMPGARWFPGASLNYVAQALFGGEADRPAVLGYGEPGSGPARQLSWNELRQQVAALAATLRTLGVRPGDSVVAYLPDVPEAVVAFLATASLGAIWAVCGQDYTARAAIDRLGQLDPVVVIAADGYRYGGRVHDRCAAVTELVAGLPGVKATVLVERTGIGKPACPTIPWSTAVQGESELRLEPVGFDHPLWVLFSSGTTGLPKGIVHGHGGVTLEHLKTMALHLNLGRDDVFFWYTTPSWMMWNYRVAGLLTGSTIVCYDGSPSYPAVDALWQLAADVRATVMGTSPGYLLACAKAGVTPQVSHDLSALRVLGATGSILPAASYHWVARAVGEHVQLVSTTGGTDVVTGFAGAAPTTPVWPGEISAPCLGVALECRDSTGRPVVDGVGELVINAPMPSMPLRFWNDPDGERYRQAYFSRGDGLWYHGDWITVTSRGSVVVHGRSDATLNRNGIRMGSADIYRVVEEFRDIADSLVVGVERPDGSYWMPLFVQLAQGRVLNEELSARVRSAIREQVSPRHVPDEIIAAPMIPRTRTGKKLEIPVKRLLQGWPVEQVADTGGVDDVDALRWYTRHALADATVSGR